MNGFSLPPIEIILSLGIVLFLAIGLHEYAHCKLADLAGDPTPSSYGRVTLNLTKHFEPVGTVMMILTSLTGFGIGWGRPAPIDPSKMKNPRLDTFIAVAGGPLSNICQALVYAIIFRVCLGMGAISGMQLMTAVYREHTTFLAALLGPGMIVNLSLAFFNLIPLGPLDGHWLLGLMLPDRQAAAWFNFNRTSGTGILLALILLGQVSNFSILSKLVGPPVIAMFRLLTGLH